MGIGSNHSIRKTDVIFHLYDIGQGLQINLMYNAHAGRENPHIFKVFLSPFQKFISFPVTFKFLLHIDLQGVWHAKGVNLNGVIND